MIEHNKPKFFAETLGFSPVGLRIKQALIALRGEEDLPKAKIGLSSLRQLHPLVAAPLWRGRTKIPNKVIMSNLFNLTQSPIEEGWSVQKTMVKDFRDKKLSYDSHNGVDFAVPINTILLSPAPGKIVKIISEFHRGGLKIIIDHGDGLLSCSAHLARSLVKVGQVIKRGEEIAITGYSGLDGLATFPFGIPHVHFNVWLNSIPIDPFSDGKNVAIWNNNNLPIPSGGKTENEIFIPSPINEENLERVINDCITPKVKSKLLKIEDLYFRAMNTVFEMNYYPTRFKTRINIFSKDFDRDSKFDLPFYKEKFDGIVFIDEI
jgi:murein DD-endopeptidase